MCRVEINDLPFCINPCYAKLPTHWPVLFRDLNPLRNSVLPDNEVQKPMGAVETIDAKEW